MNKVFTDLGIAQGPFAFQFEQSGGEPAVTTLPGDGVLIVTAGVASAFILADGSILKGVRWLSLSGSALTGELEGAYQAPMITLEAEPGGVITCVNESLDVVEPAERLYCVGGGPVLLNENTYQLFLRRYDLGSGPGWRTKISNWSP